MQTSLVKIPQGMGAQQHMETCKQIMAHRIDGIELSWSGAAHGPVWLRNIDHDLSFLKYYAGIRTLRIGLPNVTDLSPLTTLADSLEYLHISEFDHNQISFDVLGNMHQLKFLSVAKHTKGLDSITKLRHLTALTLKSYHLDDLPFLNDCNSLRTLKIHLGGGTDLQAIKKLNSLEELDILWVKKLSDISAISALKSLVRLKIEDEQHITALPDLSRLKHLKNIRLQNVGGLTDISAVASSHIKEFILTGPIRDADMLIPLATHKGIERVYTYLKNKSSQKKAEALLGAKFTKQMIFDMDNRASLHYFDLKEMIKLNT